MFSNELHELRRGNLLRTVPDRDSRQGPRIRLKGRELINFSSNDYLGLAGHPDIILAAKNAIDEFGFGGGASRLLSGGSVLHGELEASVAQFKSTEAALIFNSGYSANAGIIPAIAREGDVLFSDELNHASIVDGCRLSRARTVIYRHRDAEHLSYSMKHEEGGRRIVVTDTVFSMDGDIAPLKEIYDICSSLIPGRHAEDSLILYIDDAHGTGVLGGGRGALSHFDIRPEPWIIQMGTFSKALGSVGAFVAGSRDIIDWLVNTARSFFFSTALPACAAAASAKAVELIEDNSTLIERLWDNRNGLAAGLREIGFDTAESETPIIPLKTGSPEEALRLSQHLYDRGVYAPAIRPPTVRIPRVRITVTAAHSGDDIRHLIHSLKEIMSCGWPS